MNDIGPKEIQKKLGDLLEEEVVKSAKDSLSLFIADYYLLLWRTERRVPLYTIDYGKRTLTVDENIVNYLVKAEYVRKEDVLGLAGSYPCTPGAASEPQVTSREDVSVQLEPYLVVHRLQDFSTRKEFFEKVESSKLLVGDYSRHPARNYRHKHFISREFKTFIFSANNLPYKSRRFNFSKLFPEDIIIFNGGEDVKATIGANPEGYRDGNVVNEIWEFNEKMKDFEEEAE